MTEERRKPKGRALCTHMVSEDCGQDISSRFCLIFFNSFHSTCLGRKCNFRFPTIAILFFILFLDKDSRARRLCRETREYRPWWCGVTWRTPTHFSCRWRHRPCCLPSTYEDGSAVSEVHWRKCTRSFLEPESFDMRQNQVGHSLEKLQLNYTECHQRIDLKTGCK